MLVLYLDLPNRDQSVPGPPAQAADAQGRFRHCDRFKRAGSGPAGSRVRRPRGGKSGTRPDAPRTGRQNRRSFDQADAAGADGFRAETLSGTAPAHDRRNVEYNGRDSEEHALPGDTEIKKRVGADAVVGSWYLAIGTW